MQIFEEMDFPFLVATVNMSHQFQVERESGGSKCCVVQNEIPLMYKHQKCCSTSLWHQVVDFAKQNKLMLSLDVCIL